MAAAGGVLWVGTARGLVRWTAPQDSGENAQPKPVVMTTADGLPADKITALSIDSKGGVWALTPRGLARFVDGQWKRYPSPPVGDLVTGLVALGDGAVVLAAGSDGLARLRDGRWEHLSPGTTVTALAADGADGVWAGTSGKGVIRVSQDDLLHFGATEGNDIDNVRAMVAGEGGVVLLVGDSPGGPRASYYDGTRFYSYHVEAPGVLEWVSRGDGKVLLGSGHNLWALKRVSATAKLTGAVRLTFVDSPVTNSLKARRASKPPRFDTEPVGVRLPDGVTSVATDGHNLYVGTRLLGVTRIDRTKETPFRLFDLTSGAERLSVACVSNDECYVATGGPQAWRFDGQSFETTSVDPERGSHVLAVVRDQGGAVLALHRGPSSKEVRISQVGGRGAWEPIGVTSLEVPLGVPDLNFASVSPRGQLWVGLRYMDREQDAIDFGAARVNVRDGKVVYYRQRPRGASTKVTVGPSIPSDVNAIAFHGEDEVWFSSKSGAVRLIDRPGESRPVSVFNENHGLLSELLYDIVVGLNGQIWVATSKGIGQWDGANWSFPKSNQLDRPASALARDSEGRVWVGGQQGVMEVVDEQRRHFIGTRTGLLDDKVLSLTVDLRGRVWALTQKGISIIEPL